MTVLRFFSLLFILSVFVYAQDHSDFIEGPFETPQEVTETCLMCHDDAATDLMKTRHWNWQGEPFELNGDTITVGKRNLINNFCISVPSNYPRCTSCHVGYGWKDMSFDFEDAYNIDCLICHDQTGTYTKTPTGAGIPDTTVNLTHVAQNVGAPQRNNCGICHFDGGGGTGVKHGDLDDELLEPTYELDVHMGGLDFACIDCHTTENHKISGASHGSMAQNTNHFSCMQCHAEDVHENETLNQHTAHVACETCHIPQIARGLPTKTYWDWSEAGKDIEVTNDEHGMPIYSKQKGSFKWGKNIRPEYYWHNGGATYYLPGDTIDPEKTVQLNSLNGNIDQKEAKIYPFKVMRGKQPFDPNTNMMIMPHLFGKEGYWKTFDWVKAAEIGMKAVGLAFSGEVAFIETEMYWPINHTVAPADNALKCTNCHGIKGDHLLNWEALGYTGDPMVKGGRVENGLIKE